MGAIAFERRTLDSAASILLNNIANILNNDKSNSYDFDLALKPFAVTQRTRPIIEKLGIDKTNRAPGRLKRPPAPKPALRLVVDHFKTSLSDPGAKMPDNLADWRTILTRYSLNLLADYATWTLVIHFVIAHRVDIPGAFSEIRQGGADPLSASSPYGELVRSLWKAVKLEFAAANGITPFTMQFRTKDFSLVEALRAQNAQESEFGIELATATEDLQLPENPGRLGHIARITPLRNIDPDSQPRLRFLSIGAHANILEQVRHTLPSVASVIGCRLSFCSLLSISPFPYYYGGGCSTERCFPALGNFPNLPNPPF